MLQVNIFDFGKEEFPHGRKAKIIPPYYILKMYSNLQKLKM